MTRAKLFWENKILRWEKARYDFIFNLNPLSWSVQSRLNQSLKTLDQRLKAESSIFEIGCGSGILAQRLKVPIRSYVGIDIAQNAIDLAKSRSLGPKYDFVCADALQFPFPKTDVTVFLGLIDWIHPKDLESFFTRLNSHQLLFSHTTASTMNPYRLYRKWMDHPKHEDEYQARLNSVNEIAELLKSHGYSGQWLHRPNLLNPGALVWAEKIV